MNALFGDITVAMTTFPPRLQTAIGVLRNLWPQCNHLRACFNGFSKEPKELLQFIKEIKGSFSDTHTFEYLLAGEGGQVPDLGCNNKMRWIDECDGYYLTADDDIYYPPNYVQRLVEGIDRYNGMTVCTMHGKILHANGEKDVLYLGTRIFRDTEITIPGMGVGGCVPKRIGLTWSVFDKGKNSGDDELIAVWCTKHKVKRICLKHDRHWLKELKPEGYALWSDDESKNQRLRFVRREIGLDKSSKVSVTSTPIISIVIPCHKCQNTISKLFDVLEQQTFKDWECVCVDDMPIGEEDGRNVIRRYSDFDERIKLIVNSESPGAGENRNLGMANSIGKYIWFVDCDDELGFDEDGLKTMVGEMEKSSADFHVFPAKMHVDGKYARSWLDLQTTDFEFYRSVSVKASSVCSNVSGVRSLWQAVKIVPWNKVYERRFLDKYSEILQYQNTHFANDNRFLIQVLRHFETAAFHVMEPVYIYNKSDHSISGLRNKAEHLEDVASLFDWIVSLSGNTVLDKWLLQNRLKATGDVIKLVEDYVVEQKSETHECFRRRMSRLIGDKLSVPLVKPLLKNFPLLNNIQQLYEQSVVTVEPKKSEVEIPVSRNQTFADTGTEKHDAVFILGDGSIHRDVELLLAVHSLRKFCPFIDRVFIVGSKPRCDLSSYNVIHIPCEDRYKSKDANIMLKTSYAIRHISDLTDDFLLCSDDQLVSQKCTWNDFKPKYIVEYDEKNAVLNSRKKDTWSGRLCNTLKAAKLRNGKAWFYEPHIWSPINKESFKEMLTATGGLGKAGIIFSQYYNFLSNLDHEPIHDHRFFNSDSLNWEEELKDPPKFIAYNDKAFASEEFRNKLILLLK